MRERGSARDKGGGVGWGGVGVGESYYVAAFPYWSPINGEERSFQSKDALKKIMYYSKESSMPLTLEL